MDSSAEEEFKIPLLDNFCSPELKNRIRYSCPFIVTAALIVFYVAVFALLAWAILTVGVDDEIQPEIELNSLLVCPTVRESVIWDLKFDIINTYNDSYICDSGMGDGFEFSIYLYNQSKLLTKAFAIPTDSPACIEPGSHTSVIGLVEASCSIQDLNDYLDPTSGTVRLDLKVHSYSYDLVCGDAKVDLSSNSSSSSSSSCGSMVGDPFACSYQSHSVTTRWSLLHFFILLVLLVVLGLLIALHLFLLRRRVQLLV